MPEEEYEVRGHHEVVLDAEAEANRGFARRIALFSAVLATIGAVGSFLGGHTQNEALYHKNEAVLLKARASDQWAYFQAEEIKRHIAEATASLAPARAAALATEADRYRQRAATLRAQAEAFDRASDRADAAAAEALHPHTKLALAVTLVQIAIALASIAALTERRWLLRAAGLFGLVGTALGVIAWW